jgi:MscS family membrane protein
MTKIKDMLDELIMVYFDLFQDGYLNLFFYFYTKTTAWVEHLNVNQDGQLKSWRSWQKSR